ncbi:hypothetical protein H6504_01745 [Candidatus Woesearchaeota archaeon]|nr:hypothetical protein [Candidatus Woesearchaeota archaeon]
MGFGTIVASVMMFIAVLLLSTTVIVVFKDVVDDSSTSMRIQSEGLSNNLRTDLDILSAVYDNDTTTTTVTVLNTGKTTLDITRMDVFINGLYVSRNESIRTIQVEPSSEIKNLGLFDPSEILIVTVNQTLDNTTTNTAAITTQYGNKDEELITT